MTLVMDGVRRTSAPVMPVVMATMKPRPRPNIVACSGETRQFVVGMDGIRRPAPMSPRDMLVNMEAPVAAEAAVAAWQMPSLRLPNIEWRRPMIAFGLVASALVVSGLMAQTLATPHRATARAAQSSAERPAPTKPPVAAPAVAVTPAPVPHKTGLQQLLNDFVAGAGGASQYGIVVKDMTTGETANINPDKQMESASLYKLFVAQRIYQRIDLGQTSYGQAAGGGTGRNINDCLTIMINISDNGCGQALGDILGWGAQDQALRAEGYNNTSLASPQQTSAGDVATLFTRLYNGTLVSSGSSDKFTGLLKDQRVNNRLPVGLPAGTGIAHKTGDLDGFMHDAGIVYGPKTNYLVSVMSGSWNAPGNEPTNFAALSSQLWDYFER
jgi:beta-lactamase class A